jgi:hypothetical protein
MATAKGTFLLCYQLAFRIPGILPSNANWRSMILLMPNFRYTLRERPVI